MGTYANLFIEYKKDGKWNFINPVYKGKKVNSIYKQGIIRDVFRDTWETDNPCIKEFPKNMSEELSEYFKTENPKEKGAWNLRHVYLNDLYNYAVNKVKKYKEDIKEEKGKNKIEFLNNKINLITEYLINSKECFKETLQEIKELPEENYEFIRDLEEEMSDYEYLKELCSNIAFLVEFITDDMYWGIEDYKNIRIVGYCC